ncbi:phosphoribosylformylglycinamidine synthase I [Dehalogenimonas etheniformans]|uniref:phosphoribosylformylglycinamidine synthase I n=1 Tax=Dehalogenimonas etheniformans TaxID=1536648 RepID=UPI000CC5498B|nr:phosphoribosylformylglycinamidine synthase I [Dehalogenimonas etheniformans]QNT76606.1 phosphoribosylformylglycinamidine synthase I [Dehalogenimonas etheniformans]
MVRNVRVMVLRAPGTNADRELAFAFELAGGIARLTHINELISGSQKLSDYQILALPGGFSYGDDLGAGKVQANEMRLRIFDDLKVFIDRGSLILGVCNGFQALIKTGILPGPPDPALPHVTLTNNDSGKFECRWIKLVAEPASDCVWTKDIERLEAPVAHGEGKLIAAPEMLSRLRPVFYYANSKWQPTSTYPANPNGSMNNIAGLTDDTGRVFALMPHPERFVHASQHPQWTRRHIDEPGQGLRLFENGVAAAKGI